MPFVGTEQAIERIARGEMIIVVDGPDREDEGDLTMAASFVSPQALNFMISFGRGLLCMPCEASRLDELRIGPMVRINDASGDTPFAVSIDHSSNTTGISVGDRARTISSIVEPDTRPWDLRRPGHVFPLRARDGGVLERGGHTEASVDLCRLAGLPPVAVICEVLNEDGSVARVPDLERFALHHGIAIATIEDLIAFRSATAPATRIALG